MIAINDGIMLENSIYILLKKYFRQERYYVDLIELFHEVGSTHSRTQALLTIGVVHSPNRGWTTYGSTHCP